MQNTPSRKYMYLPRIHLKVGIHPQVVPFLVGFPVFLSCPSLQGKVPTCHRVGGSRIARFARSQGHSHQLVVDRAWSRPNHNAPWQRIGNATNLSHTIPWDWYIYLHLVDFYGKCTKVNIQYMDGMGTIYHDLCCEMGATKL